MAKAMIIARQSSHPTGLLGRVVARVMAHETASVNDWVLRAVEAKPGESILELGSGHGRSLARLARAVEPGGRVVGVDPSEVMRRTAERRNTRAIAERLVRVEPGGSEHVPYPDGSFDKWVSVHTVYFWPDLLAGLSEAVRVVRPGGLIFLAFHPIENTAVAAKLPTSVYALYSVAEIESSLARVGCEGVDTITHPKTGVALTRAQRTG